MKNQCAFLLMLCAMAGVLVACEEDRRAEILFEQASALQKEGRYEEAIEKLQEIEQLDPQSDVARVARRELASLRNLAMAEQRYPLDQALELVQRTTRAVETFQVDQGRWPVHLQELVPRWLDTISLDPWGRPLRYERTATGYRVTCFGADGQRGGAGSDGDMVVENGEFVMTPVTPQP
jgi:tetratricopeptide (TPR) repeat protein